MKPDSGAPSILLIHPPIRFCESYIDYPPFVSYSVWCTAAHLRSRGARVHVLDANSRPDSEIERENGKWILGTPVPALLDALPDGFFHAAILHAPPLTFSNPFSKELQALVRGLRHRYSSLPIFVADLHVGGMNATDYDPAPILTGPDAPDGVLRFEAEESLDTLSESLRETGRPPWPKGSVIHGRPMVGRIRSYGGRLYEAVDLPSFSGFLGRFLNASDRPNPFRISAGSLPFKSSRGCAYSCSFCTSRPGREREIPCPWRPMDSADLDVQLERLGAMPGVEKLVVLDEAANTGRRPFLRLLDGARRNGLKLEFPNGLRADGLDEEILERLKDCISLLSLSPESGSERTLASLIGKKQSLAAVERALEIAHRIGLPTALHFIVGFPGESGPEILQTFREARRLYERYGAEPWVQFAVALPGTRLYRQAKDAGFISSPPPEDFASYFQSGPMLKDGSTGLSNTDLIRLKETLERVTGRRTSGQ